MARAWQGGWPAGPSWRDSRLPALTPSADCRGDQLMSDQLTNTSPGSQHTGHDDGSGGVNRSRGAVGDRPQVQWARFPSLAIWGLCLIDFRLACPLSSGLVSEQSTRTPIGGTGRHHSAYISIDQNLKLISL